MNKSLRSILNANIKKMLSDARLASDLNHPGLTGKLRELFLNDLILPLLNAKYSSGSGKVTDYEGKLSKEMDLCIYSTSLHPPFFFSRSEKTGIYPIESVLACFEIKSLLSLKELRDAFEKFHFMERKLKFTAGFHNENHQPQTHYFLKPEYSVFAYDIDRSSYEASSILDMYKKVDPNWDSDPVISSICVANKGCLTYTVKGWLHMAYEPNEQINEEVIFYLCALIQGLPRKEISRGIPRIGYYLTNPSKTDRFEGGKPVGHPWSDGVLVFRNLYAEDM